MSREIKYLAYFKPNGQGQTYAGTYEVISIDFNYQLIKVKRESVFAESLFRFDEVILREFTGLRDKNGKEVFEGAILGNSLPEIEVEGEVEWDNDLASFVLVSRDAFGKAMATFRFWNKPSYQMWRNSTEFEIVGDIYSNPELIRAELK